MTAAAARYQGILRAAHVRERSLLRAPARPSELELQAHWFAGDFGTEFTGTSGERVEIVQFGTWNREAGPDFRDAAVRVNSGEPIRGSIEFDLADRNWEQHGHAINPAFAETILHVFIHAGPRRFFTRTLSHRSVPQIVVDPLRLRGASASLDQPLAKAGRCHAPLRELPEERVRSILEAAAQFRLQRKAARLQAMSRAHGRDEAVFQELAAALGYKENKLPFTLLAQRLPLSLLRGEGSKTEALLFGAAGFLHEADLASYESGTRAYLRGLWDDWWQQRAACERLILPAGLWQTSGVRPLNHPHRRMGALAVLARHWPKVARLLEGFDPAKTREFFAEQRHPYWDFHYTLTSPGSLQAMALVGESRVAEMLANVFFPLAFAADASLWKSYAKLPARLTNRRVETAAARLFGDDPRRPLFLKTVALQQALLQIYEDFCLQDDSDCAHCPFPEQMQKWTPG